MFAAASLKNALDDVRAQYERETGKHVTVSYAASSTLAKQIEAAAPADIFLSADLDWMDYLAERKLIKPDTRVNLLGNSIVLIAPVGGTASIAIGPNFPLAAALGRRPSGDGRPEHGPGRQVRQGGARKARRLVQVAERIAPAENVRAALLLVSRGETPLGIVYKTDAAADKGVKIVASFPADTHPPIVYPIALIANSANPDAAGLPLIAHCRSGDRFSRSKALPSSTAHPPDDRSEPAGRTAMSLLTAFSSEELTAIRLSLKVAFWAMTASLPVGVAWPYCWPAAVFGASRY